MQRRFALLPVLAASAVLLAGCGDQPASAAAVVGPDQVALQTVTGQLEEIAAVTGQVNLDPEFTRVVVRNNVVYSLVGQAAAAAGVSVDESAVDKALGEQVEFAGGVEALDRRAAASAIAPSMIESDVRTGLLARAMIDELVASGLPEEQAVSLLNAQVQRYSEEIGTTINPRFGTWDVASFGIAPDPGAPSAPGGSGPGQLAP
jgi:hypothetical protein